MPEVIIREGLDLLRVFGPGERRDGHADSIDQLSLLKPATLKKLRDDLKMITDQASARLAWEMQHKESQTQDGAT